MADRRTSRQRGRRRLPELSPKVFWHVSFNFGHNPAVYDFLDKPIKAGRGVVRLGGILPAGVLIEVFGYGEDAPFSRAHEPDQGQGRRLAACVTDGSGRFAFNVPSGRYEICASQLGFNPTSFLVVVDNRKDRRRDLVTPISPGD